MKNSYMELDAKLSKLYKKRFEGELYKKNEIWKVLCSSFFQKYITEKDLVVDIGAGYCEFINNSSRPLQKIKVKFVA